MTTSHKVIITIILAFCVLGKSQPQSTKHLVVLDQPHSPDGNTDLEFLQRAFRVYNFNYFHDRLNTPEMNTDEEQMMATTHCEDNGSNCRINFNLGYLKAPRNASLAVLHEMCHMQTWSEDQDSLIPQEDNLTHHGKHWRACMLNLDNQGAFRNIIIDYYQGQE